MRASVFRKAASYVVSMKQEYDMSGPRSPFTCNILQRITNHDQETLKFYDSLYRQVGVSYGAWLDDDVQSADKVKLRRQLALLFAAEFVASGDHKEIV